jgi:hypothetical protein
MRGDLRVDEKAVRNASKVASITPEAKEAARNLRRGAAMNPRTQLLGTAAVPQPRRRQQPERDLLHIPLCQHLGWRAHPTVVWWHTPSGGSRHKAEAANLQKMGTKRGLPDLLLLHAGVLHALELKNGKAGRVSPAQSEMLIALAKAGCRTAVARDLDEALHVLEHWDLIRGDGARS